MSEDTAPPVMRLAPSGPKGEKSGSGEEPAIKTYDFKHPKLVSKETMRALHNIHELLSRSLNRIFTDSISQKAEVSLQAIDEVIFSEFLGELEPPTALFLFNIEEMGDWAVMEMHPSFCLYCIERLSGSRENEMKPSRALTRIEERVISRIVNKIFKELGHVWSPYLNITIQNHVYESKPANIRTISSHVPGIVVRYVIRVGGLTVPYKLCYPYAMLKEQMNLNFHKNDKDQDKKVLSPVERRTFENYMKSVSVPLQVLLGRVKISMKELVGMEEGDVIKLDQLIDEPLDVRVKGTRKMTGYPGKINGMKAIKIFEVQKNRNLKEE